MFDIGGFSTLLIIAGIVELVKKLGVKGNVLIFVSVGIGTLFGLVFRLAEMYPTILPWVELAYYGLAFGLGASGLYDLSKSLIQKE